MPRMKQLSNSFLYSLLSIGGSVATSYPCSRLPMVFWNSSWSPSSSFRLAQGYAAFSVRAVPLWNKLPTIVHDTYGYQLAIPELRSTHLTHLLLQPIPFAHMNPFRNPHQHDTNIPPHLVVYSSPYISLGK